MKKSAKAKPWAAECFRRGGRAKGASPKCENALSDEAKSVRSFSSGEKRTKEKPWSAECFRRGEGKVVFFSKKTGGAYYNIIIISHCNGFRKGVNENFSERIQEGVRHGAQSYFCARTILQSRHSPCQLPLHKGALRLCTNLLFYTVQKSLG